MNTRWIAYASVVAWLAVAALSIWDFVGNDSAGGSEPPYALESLCIAAAIALTSAWAWSSVGPDQGGWLFKIGAAICVLSILFAAIASWAHPLWAALLAIGVGLLAASGPASRWRLLRVTIGLVAGLGVLFVALLAEVGPTDSYGDHPQSFAIGLFGTAVLTAAAVGVDILSIPIVPTQARRQSTHEVSRGATVRHHL